MSYSVPPANRVPPTPPAPPTRLFTLGEVGRIIAAAFIAGGAVSYLLVDYDSETLDVLARIASIVASVTVVHMIFEARRCRRIERLDERLEQLELLLDARLERQRRWAVYSDLMSDLGGIDPEDSGEISIDRRHPHS